LSCIIVSTVLFEITVLILLFTISESETNVVMRLHKLLVLLAKVFCDEIDILFGIIFTLLDDEVEQRY